MFHARGLISAAIGSLAIIVSAAAVACADDNVLGLPAQGVANKGTLFVVGGGHPPDSVYNEFVRLAGGKNAHLLLIPSGHAWATQADIDRRFNGWKSMQVASFNFLDAKTRAEADSASFALPLSTATGVWIAGGSQSRLASLYGGTKVEDGIRQIFERGGVIGGTSAGAAVMSRVMIQYGGPTEPVLGRGFGLIDRAVVDQHFSQRGRYPRLLTVLEDHPGLAGLGIDEGTALVLQGNQARVLGDSKATVCFTSPNQQGTMLYRLKAGQKGDLAAMMKSSAVPRRVK
ncbi:MAG: cyanophycinase [Planctomycetia bacterium]|nr:cyanophycinase [Planctomycetia bacterium]